MSKSNTSKHSFAVAAACAAVLLLLPMLSSWLGLPSREQLYRSADRRENISWFVYHQLFGDTSPIDIAIFGSSHVAAGLRADEIQRLLSLKLQRPAKVICFPSVFRGVDLHVAYLRDLLSRRKVGMAIFDSDIHEQLEPNPNLYRILQADMVAEAIGYLPGADLLRLYAMTAYATPRQVLMGLLPSKVVPPEPNYMLHQGSVLNDEKEIPSWAFARAKALPASNPGELRYGPERFAELSFQPMHTAYQIYFLRRFIEIAHQAGVQPVIVRFPYQMTASQRDLAIPLGLKDLLLAVPVPIIAVRPPELFKGLTEEQIQALFMDPLHFNAGGNMLHTAALAPAIVNEYVRTEIHHRQTHDL